MADISASQLSKKKKTLAVIIALAALLAVSGVILTMPQAVDEPLIEDDVFRTYILENAEEKRFDKMLSVTLYNDGTVGLATPPFSSYALPKCTYSFVGDELFIYTTEMRSPKSFYGIKWMNRLFGVQNRNVIAIFSVIDDNTLILKTSTVPLYAGKRYIAIIDGELAETGTDNRIIYTTDKPLISKIEDFVIKLYENQHFGEGNDLSEEASGDILMFLNNKIEAQRYADKHFGTEREHYNITSIVNRAETVEHISSFVVYAVIKYNYAGMDVITTEGRQVYVKYDHKSGLIIDCLVPMDLFYDESLRVGDKGFTFDDFVKSEPFSFGPEDQVKHDRFIESLV